MFSLSKSKENFAFIQVEADKIISQLFRFNERAYDGVLYKARHTEGDFRTLPASEPVLNSYIEEVQKNSDCRIILGFHSGMFTTAETVITIRRDSPSVVID